MDEKTAGALVQFLGPSRYLNGRSACSLYLDGLTVLDAVTATKLARFKGGRLSLKGLTSLNAATATELAKFKGDELVLYGLTSLDERTETALKKFKGKIKWKLEE